MTPLCGGGAFPAVVPVCARLPVPGRGRTAPLAHPVGPAHTGGMWQAVLLLAVPALVLAALVVTTAQGSRRRGTGRALAVLAGLAFPVTWALWYVVDEHHHQPRRASGPSI